MVSSDTLAAMNNTLQKSRPTRPPFQSGQVWELADSSLQIGLVGKTLVHYKHYKGKTKRAPISLAGIKVLEKYLKVNKATLVQE
jgi:hypothetical protein